jgi:hypothetical protein
MALRLKSDCGEIEVLFHHREYSAQEIYTLVGEIVDGPRRCSGAVVIVNEVVHRNGVAICHPKDNFNKALGRQKALTKALCGLSKISRTDVWLEYNAEIGFA